MSDYYLLDITGTDADCQVTNFPFFLFQPNMKLEFKASPIFMDSLTLTLTDGTQLPLVKDVDWEVIQDEDVDNYAMSKAKLEDPTFSKTLIRSVTLKSTTHVGKRVAANFQQFYNVNPKQIVDDGTPLELTPELIKSLIAQQAYARQLLTNVNSPIAANLDPPDLLPFDLHKQIPGNLVTNEPVIVNTMTNAKVIRPRQGAFFADSTIVSVNGVPLVRDVDYVPIVLSSLTNKSTNVSGIYKYILITKPVSGNALITYHPVGGDVQPDDVRSLFDQLVSISDFLSNSLFVTEDMLMETKAFKSQNSRINELEDTVRRLLTGSPTYGDSTLNNAITRPIEAPNTLQHWWTIATLYQVEGSTDIINTDQFRARVYLPDSKIAVTFSLDVNLDQLKNRSSFSTENLVFDPKYTLFDDIDVSYPQYPMFRIVWNESTYSGIALQIGVPLTTLVDRMVVENLSTAESCWVLNIENQLPIGQVPSTYSDPEDSGFLLPDGVSVWSPSSILSRQEVHVPRFDKGYLFYAGAVVNIAGLVTEFPTSALFSSLLPSYFPLGSVKSVVVTMSNLANNFFYDVEVPLTGTEDNAKTGKCVFSDSGKTVFDLTVAAAQDAEGDITISLNATELAYALPDSTPSAKSDLVRYIRVKV